MPQEEVTGIWLTITNVRLSAREEKGDKKSGEENVSRTNPGNDKEATASVLVQVQGDAGEAADPGPSWLKCDECTGKSGIEADKLYDKILEALKNNRKVRGKLKCKGERLVIKEVEVQYQ